jgi:lipooligosaccharide transport system permease protein
VNAPRMTQYWVTVYKRTWRGWAITNFLMPFLFLTGMGVGLGSFVDDNAGPQALDGVSYLAFLAPGLLATNAMQTSLGAAMFPVLSGFKWDKTYFSMAATPLRPTDIVTSYLVLVAFRVLTAAAVFMAVLTAYGALQSWWGAPAALLVVVLLGMAHAAPMIGITSRLKDETVFALVFRLGIMPMVLFSGAFFPISQLGSAAWLAYVTPIWHGVELSRMLTLGAVDWLPALGHLLYLLVFVVVGWWFAVVGFHKRLGE